MSFEDEHGLGDKKPAKKVVKQAVHKDTNTAIKKGLQKVKAATSSHDSVNCDSDYCTIC